MVGDGGIEGVNKIIYSVPGKCRRLDFTLRVGL